MDNLKTIRGQSARIIKDKNGLFFIELYANGKWVIPVRGYDEKFTTKTAAEEFFIVNKDYIHC